MEFCSEGCSRAALPQLFSTFCMHCLLLSKHHSRTSTHRSGACLLMEVAFLQVIHYWKAEIPWRCDYRQENCKNLQENRNIISLTVYRQRITVRASSPGKLQNAWQLTVREIHLILPVREEPTENSNTVRENTFSLSVKTAKKTQTTGRGNNFLGCVKPTGYKGIYPVGPQTVKKRYFSCQCLFSLSTSSHQGNIFFLSVIFSLTTGDHQRNLFPCRC